jgi:hypothetical protein
MTGGLDATLHFAFDREWMCQLLRTAPVHYLGQPVAAFRHHRQAKSTAKTDKFAPELLLIMQRHIGCLEKSDRQYGKALIELYHSADCLNADRFCRKPGLRYLINSLVMDWRVCLLREFLAQSTKALLPAALVRAVHRMRVRAEEKARARWGRE